MCQSKAEGGQRCHSHTTAALTAAETTHARLEQERAQTLAAGREPTNELRIRLLTAAWALEDARTRHASTTQGETDLTARTTALTAPDEQHEADALHQAITDGRRLRERAANIRESVQAGQLTPEQATDLAAHPSNTILGTRHILLDNPQPAVPNQAAREAAAAMIPREGNLTDYYQATDRKHFGNPTTPGSTFTGQGINRLEDVVTLAAIQRRQGLTGDDRAQLLALGAPPDAFTPTARYLLVRTPGTINITRSTGLPDTTPIQVIRTKPGTPCTLVLDRKQPGTPTSYGTIIIGAHPTDPAREVVYTAHPGPIVPSDTTDRMAPYEGRTITLGQARTAYHGDLWLTTTN